MDRAVFFDLDGTLIDSSNRHHAVYKSIFRSLSNADPTEKDRFWDAKRREKRTIDLLPETFSDSEIDRFERKWLDTIETKQFLARDEPFPATEAVLIDTSERSDAVVLVTNRQKEDLVAWQLDELGLDKYFDRVLVNTPSQNTTKAELILREYPDINGNGIIVGDSASDLEAGQRLDFMTVATTTGIRAKPLLQRHDPQFIIDEIGELLDLWPQIE